MPPLALPQKTRSNYQYGLAIAAALILLLLLTLLLYTFLHEGGHALMGLLFGGKILGFSVNFFNLSAHVGINGEFSQAQNALIAAAGVSLPVLACMGFILLAPKKREPLLNWFKLLFFMGAVNAVLAWIVIPVLVMMGNRPSDDSYNFLNITRLPPLVVSGAALAVYLACWYLFLRRMGGFRALVALFRAADLNFRVPDTQRTAWSLAGLGVVLLAATVGLTQALPDRAFDAPPGYQPIGEVQLSNGVLNDVTVYRFSVDQPATLSFFFDLYHLKGGPMEIHLTGPNNYDNLFFQILDPQADLGQASVNPQHLRLEKGEYEIKFAFPKSEGRIRIYQRNN